MTKPKPAGQGSLNRTDLVNALVLAAAAVERGSTIPVLSGVRLAFSTGECAISATDMDRRITVSIGAVDLSGAIVVNAALLRAAADKLVGERVAVAFADGKLVLTGQNGGRRSLPTLPAEDFPDGMTGEFGAAVEIKRKALIEALEGVRTAASTEETRYYLRGALLTNAGPGLRFVATDGHRLHVCDCEAVLRDDAWPDIIMSSETISLLLAMLAKNDDESVEIETDGRKFRIAFDTVELVAKAIDGTYPDYTRVIPSASDTVLSAKGPDLVRAIEAVAAIVEGKVRAVRLDLGKTPGVSVRHAEFGEADEPIEGASAEGPTAQIGINAKYAGVALKLFGDRLVRWRIDGAAGPTLIECDELPGVRAVVMPMRV